MAGRARASRTTPTPASSLCRYRSRHRSIHNHANGGKMSQTNERRGSRKMRLEWELAKARREYRSSGFRTTAHKLRLKEKCAWILTEIDALQHGREAAGSIPPSTRQGECSPSSA